MNNTKITAIAEIGQYAYKTQIFSGGHVIYADEPENLGGTDEAMQPASLLLASLGSCTVITLRMYANRKQYDLQHIKVELTLEDDNMATALTNITRKITFTGNLSNEEHARLMQIAEKCPIHKILSNPIQITTTS
ncbi:OsmC family protein [Pedobacter montanisoli]|uniref:OsmC family protein n=1 Tax=Pedobacter montanisoli TaxID=2923277 RepID=A0ABS9ZXH2_9SPHI|nr:OsmC family protein [Pedobacter montanisoli]MCJ0743008.1 OsmC family protein [Pedobacter montanisoli]